MGARTVGGGGAAARLLLLPVQLYACALVAAGTLALGFIEESVFGVTTLRSLGQWEEASVLLLGYTALVAGLMLLVLCRRGNTRDIRLANGMLLVASGVYYALVLRGDGVLLPRAATWARGMQAAFTAAFALNVLFNRGAHSGDRRHAHHHGEHMHHFAPDTAARFVLGVLALTALAALWSLLRAPADAAFFIVGDAEGRPFVLAVCAHVTYALAAATIAILCALQTDNPRLDRSLVRVLLLALAAVAYMHVQFHASLFAAGRLAVVAPPVATAVFAMLAFAVLSDSRRL